MPPASRRARALHHARRAAWHLGALALLARDGVPPVAAGITTALASWCAMAVRRLALAEDWIEGDRAGAADDVEVDG